MNQDINIQNLSRVLLVGAGGTGSEFVHALLLSSFSGHLSVVDFDIIELSNLSRQTYFSEKHIGKYKAAIISEKIELLSNGKISTEFHTKNITDPVFSPTFFKGFFCVISCVDNTEAREHINKMCFLSGTPMIDSGSSGFLGQVQMFLVDGAECYSCSGPVAQESYPVCTIRGIPESWHHCVHWAAYDLLPKTEEFISSASNNKASVTRTQINEIEKILLSYSKKLDKEKVYQILTTCKDKTEIEKIHLLACVYAEAHKILVSPLIETEKIISKTIPSLLTTNGVVGTLIYISLRSLQMKHKPSEYYLLLSSEIRKIPTPEKNKECSTCSCIPLSVTLSENDTLFSFFNSYSLFTLSLSVTNNDGHLIYDREFQNNKYALMHKICPSGSFIKAYTDKKTYLIYLIYTNN